MTIKTPISTSEFHLASYLLSKNCKLIRLDRTNPKRIRFIFTNVSQVLIDSFWANEQVRVADFINAQRELKQRIFADIY